MLRWKASLTEQYVFFVGEKLFCLLFVVCSVRGDKKKFDADTLQLTRHKRNETFALEEKIQITGSELCGLKNRQSATYCRRLCPSFYLTRRLLNQFPLFFSWMTSSFFFLFGFKDEVKIVIEGRCVKFAECWSCQVFSLNEQQRVHLTEALSSSVRRVEDWNKKESFIEMSIGIPSDREN